MNILYFASLKESLNISNEEILATPDMTVIELRLLLINQHGEQHFPSNILCAVNQVIANNSTQLNNDDEVAFYPPVTGG